MAHDAKHYCRGGEHCQENHHLCRLVPRRDDPERIRPLLQDPQYFCKVCGRSANQNSSLCKPVAL